MSEEIVKRLRHDCVRTAIGKRRCKVGAGVCRSCQAADLIESLLEDKKIVDWLDQPWVEVRVFPRFYWMSDKTNVHPSRDRSQLSQLSLREAARAAMQRDGEAPECG